MGNRVVPAVPYSVNLHQQRKQTAGSLGSDNKSRCTRWIETRRFAERTNSSAQAGRPGQRLDGSKRFSCGVRREQTGNWAGQFRLRDTSDGEGNCARVPGVAGVCVIVAHRRAVAGGARPLLILAATVAAAALSPPACQKPDDGAGAGARFEVKGGQR